MRIFSNRAFVPAVCCLFSWVAVVCANQEVPGPPQTSPIVLHGGTVHPVSGPDLPGTDVVFEKGRITAIGVQLPLPEGAKVIDVTGKHVYPGLISANTVLGLVEISAVRSTLDITEAGVINPNATAGIAINPDSELLPVARSNGVLTALSVPRTEKGLVAGTSTLINLDGWTAQSMTVALRVGLHVLWPDMTVDRSPNYPKTPEDQQKEMDARLREVREVFASARAYAVRVGNNGETKGPGSAASDLRLAAMVPAVRGEMPVFVHAESLGQIEAAVAWGTEQKLRLVIVGGQDAWRAASLLKERDVPVIIGPINTLPQRRWEGYDTPFRNPARLQAAGVRFCIASGGTDFDAMQERNLPYQAAQAVAHGLPAAEGLKSVTLYPAQILGVADRLGSIEVGKDANLIITDGDPLEISTQVETAFIAGRTVDLANRQTHLRDKYRQKYLQ